MRGLHVLLFFIALQICTSTFAQNPYIRHFTTLDGLPSNTIYQMCQDRNKFLWFTSDAGVVKFDGSNFTSYRKKDGLSSNDVVRIKEDSKGRIWFFNYNGTVNYYYNNKIYNGENAPFLNSLLGKGFFLDFYTDNNKTINFYNWQREIFSLDTNNNVSKRQLFGNINYKLPIVGNSYDFIKISYISEIRPDELMIWSSTGIYSQHIREGDVKVIDVSLRCQGVFPARNKTLYVTTYHNGIVKVTNNRKNEKIPFPGNAQKIRTILEDTEGYLWIAAYDEGVYCLKNNKVIRHFDIKNAMGLLQDHDRNIWVSTQSDGTYEINHEVLTQDHFDHTYFNNSGVNLLCDFPGNGIFCLNSQSVFLFSKENAFYKLSVPDSLQPLDIMHFFRNQTLMVGVKSKRICSYENIRLNEMSRVITYSKRRIVPLMVKKIVDDPRRMVTALFDQNNILLTLTAKPDLNTEYDHISERINNAFFNAQNELVVNGKENYLYKNKRLERYPELSRFNGTIISDHLVLNDSVELYNIDGDSLFLLKDHKFYNLTKAINTPVALQIKKAIYLDSTLYLATLRDIYVCYDPCQSIYGKPVRIKSINISFNNINDILLNRGSLYIASDDGLTVLPESSLIKYIAPPIPYVRSITVNDKNYALPSNEIKLTGKNNIHLTFGSINFFSSSATYSYMLEGAEKKWTIGTGSDLDLFYRNLPPGHYRFKLRVSKSNSGWSQPLVLPIIIQPTFFEYPVVWAIMVLLAGVLILLFFNRIKNQRMKKIELDHQLIVLEQKALQSMMNPHFIFNSLGSIQNYLLKNKGSEAIIYLSNFARLMRQNLNALNTPMIVLEEEVDRLKNYLDLEKIRLDYNFNYNIEIDPSLKEEDIYIPGMLIQPIVENSIWHGIATLKDQGNIQVSFESYNLKSMKISIRDNGIGMKRSMEYFNKDAHRQHLGMQMIKKRLDLLSKKYNTEASIIYSECYPENVNTGTLAELILPFTYSPADS